MKLRLLLTVAGAATALLTAQATAAAINEPPPAGPVLHNFDGELIPHSYTQYTFSFVAGSSATDLSFAFREDPAFLFLDDVSLTTGGGPNLVVNGDFEAGPNGANAPAGWTYDNVYGSAFAGFVSTNNPHTGSFNYYDGSVQAYDAITQQIATIAGQTYDLSFWLSDNSAQERFSALSTNGDVTDTGGNGVNLIVYAGQGIPTPGGIPEPATWALMIGGVLGAGGMLRRARRAAATA